MSINAIEMTAQGFVVSFQGVSGNNPHQVEPVGNLVQDRDEMFLYRLPSSCKGVRYMSSPSESLPNLGTREL